MQRPKSGGKRAAPHIQMTQNTPEQERAAEVETHINKMIRQWVQTPKQVLQAKAANYERTNSRRGRGPNFPEAQWTDHASVLRYMLVVVPNESGMPDVLIGKKYCDGEEKGEQPSALPRDNSKAWRALPWVRQGRL